MDTESEYSDTLVITDHSIEYDCHPYEPWKMNPNRKWSFNTDSFAFRKLFEHLVDSIKDIYRRDPKCPGTDMSMTDFTIKYSDGHTASKAYFAFKNEFSDCFDIIKTMVPPCELMPSLLEISDDCEARSLWRFIEERYDKEGLTYNESSLLLGTTKDLLIKGKTDVRCPRCGNELGLSRSGDFSGYFEVFCKTKGCLTVRRRGV